MKSLLLLSVIGVAQCLCALDTPTPISPKDGSPKSPVYEWTVVPGADYYIIVTWKVDDPACTGGDSGFTLAPGNPYYYLFPANRLCDDKTCVVQRDPRSQSAAYWNPKTHTSSQWTKPFPGGFANIHPHSYDLSEISRARGCGSSGQHNGPLHVWRWSILAAKTWNPGTDSFTEISVESDQLAYWLDETIKTPPDTPKQPSNLPQDHPVAFVNQSGMTLYLYYFIRVGGMVDCKDYSNSGAMPSQATKNFVIPAKQVGHFVFQKAQDACPLSTILTYRDVRGGNPAPETIAIGP
jgi:hypothetical protein